jgi:hypothetical protein
MGAQVVSEKLRAFRQRSDTSAPQREGDPAGTVSSEVGRSQLADLRIAAVAPAEKASPRFSFQPLQEWEGYVYAIEDDTFWARLIDVTARGQTEEEEEAEFPIADLSDSDREDLIIGAVVRWVIGYQRTPEGTKGRMSKIIFRRLPAHTPHDLKKARQEAERFQAIAWE